MSLYNLIHGFDPMAQICLQALKIDPDDIPRFRDAYLDGDFIVILTRTGGGNREYYQTQNMGLAQHPLYVSDADDEFDCTFALFRFRFPAGKIGEALAKLSVVSGPAKSLREKTEAALKALDENDPEMVKRTEGLRQQLRQAFEKLDKAEE